MRNLKKILALALVFAMAFTFTAGAADFTDKAEIGANYVDDVNMLVELGVIAGYPDGSFGPQKNITRAEFAKMAYTLKYGSDSNGELFAAQKSIFTDVEGNANVAWAKGYINYCANQKIVSGVGNNKFNPQGNITVAEATKMILVILGCDPAKEGFTGANWAANVTAKAIDLGIFKGWTGDPTALATRELVAKLMKNAVFSPVYTYSAITGAGSQLNALGDDYNQTLGEKTMGLQTVTGIVVANENYYITKDADTEDISGSVAGVAEEDETIIYYTFKGTDGNKVPRTLTIPVALEDALLGNEVSVFFKADLTSDNWYTNVELIGDVMVTADTVIYDVPAIDVDMFPNGESTSKTQITPYIAFNVDGVEKQIKASNKIARVAKEVDVQKDGTPEMFAEFGALSWTSNETARGTAISLATDAGKTDAFFTDMGTPAMTSYRFVSVDGGKTYSYIFKMVADGTNADLGAVTNYSEAKGSITIAGLGTLPLEEVAITGDIAIDDEVVYYRENGILNIVKVDSITGAVEAINDDGSAVIGGETYYLWQYAYQNAELGLYSDDTLAKYFTRNSSAMGEGTKYYVYGNLILGFEATVAEAVVEDYAVIIRSTYDEDKDLGYVTLGFADNTQATYEVGKYNIENRTNPYDDKNDKASDLANNTYFGMVVKYKVMADGRLDLSANDLGYTSGKQTLLGSKTYDDKTFYSSSRYDKGVTSVVAEEGELNVDGTRYYALNDSTVLFVLYGNPQYTGTTGAINRDENYTAVKAAAYKLADKKLQAMGDIPNMLINDQNRDSYALSYVLNTTKGMSKGIIAAAMTVGSEAAADTGDAAEAEALAYIAAAAQRYNVATGEYFLEMTIIDENGLVSTKTVGDVSDFNNNSLDFGTTIGKIEGEYAAGTFITYALNADGVITNMDNAQFLAAKNAYGSELTGLFLVNAVAERNGSLFFLNTDRRYVGADTIANAAATSIKFHEDGYEVITIDDAEYVGEQITKVSAKEDSLAQGVGNALIQVDEGQIVRVFSFIEGYNLSGAVVNASEIEEVKVVKTGTIWGATVSDFYGPVFRMANNGTTYTFSGTLNDVNFPAFSTDPVDQNGHYVYVKLDFGFEDAADAANFAAVIPTKVGDKALTAADLEADYTLELILRVDDLGDEYEIELDLDGEGAETYTFDFSGVTLG